MAVYALWNNKGGVGKSYLTFQIAAEYARTHPSENVLVIDLCPQANSSSMLLGGIEGGERVLNELASGSPKRTIAGYIAERILSPYVNPNVGSQYAQRVSDFNQWIPSNLHLVVGDEELEVLASRVQGATNPGPGEAWRIVHLWISDLIADIRRSWNVENSTVFIDCNPSFSIYTELAMSASDRLIIPFSADGSSKRAVRAVLALLYGVRRLGAGGQSEYYLNSQRFRMSVPEIYSYVGNRLTSANLSTASAFRTVVNEIGAEIYSVWTSNPSLFAVHPSGAPAPRSRLEFKRMFQAEIRDANTASVMSGALGIPIMRLLSGSRNLLGRQITVNQTQLDVQKPNIRDFVATIE
ncbi:ParA family protein [Sphingomonas aliaeris]|uniref:ParA family protein n=1 Tax=Sphingomonas aliaeris TaxID=2759526 RepID=A0A974NWL9_9SPHN|nr:ParA family protein [Sphingomonas aliaeris]QQV78291.1 ParA family protein [Sphingomonas aliaeris]